MALQLENGRPHHHQGMPAHAVAPPTSLGSLPFSATLCLLRRFYRFLPLFFPPLFVLSHQIVYSWRRGRGHTRRVSACAREGVTRVLTVGACDNCSTPVCFWVSFLVDPVFGCHHAAPGLSV